MPIDKRGSSGVVDQDVDIFDLPLDRIRLGVPAVATAPTVIAVDRDVLREKLGELRLGAGRTSTHGSVHQDESWAFALLVERKRGPVF